MNFFAITNKGILLENERTAFTKLNRTFFGYSIGLEVIFLLLFVLTFGMTIFRSIKKIKNKSFNHEKHSGDEESENNEENASDAKETNDNLIYRFDEDDLEVEKKLDDGKDIYEEDSEAEYCRDHDEHEDKYIEIDHQVTFMVPFLIGHIISNNFFSTNYISLIMIVGTILLFGVFNIKKVMKQIKFLSILFMLPAIGSFIPFFMTNHKMEG